MNKENTKAQEDMIENQNSFRVNDLVMIDYEPRNLQSSYAVKRGELYTIYKVNTTSKPFIFALKVQKIAQ